MAPALRIAMAGVALTLAGMGSYAYWRMKTTHSVDVQAARAALADDARIVCLPPPTRAAAPSGGHALGEAEARAILLHLAAAPSVRDACAVVIAATDDASSPPCDQALAASRSDIDALRASLRSDRPTLAYAVRLPLADISTDEEGRPAEPRPTAHDGFTTFTWSERVELAREARRRASEKSDAAPTLERCTELATLAHDLWRVGDLTAAFYAEPIVDAVAASCPAARAAAASDARRAFDEAANASAPPIADILQRDFAGVSLLHFGALANDKPPCDLAAALVDKGPHPTTSPELDALAQDWREAMSTSAPWRDDPEHDEATKKYVEKYAAMVARLRSAAAPNDE